MTWSSFVPANAFYDPEQGGSDVVSRLTLGKAITVTRMEAQAAQGSERLVFSPTFQAIACTNSIFKITDGTTTHTLVLPSATTLVPGGFNPSSADSGPLNVAFPARAKLVLTVVQGDPPDPTTGATGCLANNINIAVQYKTTTE